MLPLPYGKISRKTAPTVTQKGVPFLPGTLFSKSFNPNGIQVDVAGYLQKIVVSIDQESLISALVKMTHPAMPSIKGGRIRDIEMAHEL
jgi:hypothetical protein